MNLLQLFRVISFRFSDGLRGFVGDNDDLAESATLYRLADLPSIAFDLGKGGDNEAFRYFCKIESGESIFRPHMGKGGGMHPP